MLEFLRVEALPIRRARQSVVGRADERVIDDLTLAVADGDLNNLDGWPRPDRLGVKDQRAVVELVGSSAGV